MAEEEEEIIMEEMWNSLPQEVIIEILSWLLAKSLVSNFKFVWKAWRTLIHDPDFVKMHLTRGAINGDGGGGGRRVSSNNNNNYNNYNNHNNSLICKSGNELFQLHPPFNFEGGLPPTPTIAAVATKLDFDGSLSLDSRLVGSCNGLLCINDEYDESITLLNPSTRRFKVSPKQPIECPPEFYYFEFRDITYGFGCCYNSTDNIDEYKVIRIVLFVPLRDIGESSERYQIDIYYMSSDSWRRETRLREYPYIITHQKTGVSVNGALHWIDGAIFKTRRRCWDRIVSFDIRDEGFREVPIPLSCESNSYLHMDGVILINMRGCLAMIRCSNGNNNMDVDLEIWLMKEYGIKESWAEEFVIRSSDLDPPRALSGFEISSRSNAYVLKDDQILIEGGEDTDPSSLSLGYREKLVLYDINKRKIDGDFKMVGVPDQTNVNLVNYIETLVSLKSSMIIVIGVPGTTIVFSVLLLWRSYPRVAEESL